ncbi:MAG TPA: D-Ala-D-Ala carboxypeptidase family metallohydrolase [Gemmatimonadaceae bacterium]|nr:D-Ala-D-Ala carboxypeptidase family metallohydrolase [Gemmatimonadaceae bacterium]
MKRVIIAAIVGIVVIAAIVRAVTSARGDADSLRAPDSDAVTALSGVAAPAETTAAAPALPPFAVADSFFGRSGKLRFRTLTRVAAIALPGFIAAYGENAIRTPAVHRVAANGSPTPFAFVVMRPFGEKRGKVLQGYKLGEWPSERWLVGRRYFNPDGFIEVTADNVGLRLSEHFTLADFLTHDQGNVWPKFVVLQEPLIDKLELVLADLAAHGVRTDRVRVLSGFRAPYYNDRIVAEGAARSSRHQYGDAADIVIDANGDGRMDDLNRDGRLDLSDTQVILRAVERIEKQYPALVGGLGLYHAMGTSGPFAHVDVRGTSARWSKE